MTACIAWQCKPVAGASLARCHTAIPPDSSPRFTTTLYLHALPPMFFTAFLSPKLPLPRWVRCWVLGFALVLAGTCAIQAAPLDDSVALGQRRLRRPFN